MTVYLVGAGSGDSQLLTLRAAGLLARAQVVVHDRLVSREVLELVNVSARLIDVGKTLGLSHLQSRINELLISLAREHEVVVRLKKGDPFVFGRGGEEFEALHAADVSVTHRGLAHGVTIVTGTTMRGALVDFRALANPDVTLVVLRGVRRRAAIATELQVAGLSSTTPVTIIEWASTSRQRTVRCRLEELANVAVSAPAVLVIGAVASLELIGSFDSSLALGV